MSEESIITDLPTGRILSPPTEASILEILEERVQKTPDRQVFCFLEEGEFESETLTYVQLQRRSRAIAARLQQFTSPGDRVLLVYSPGLEFIPALFGCFHAGVIAVPTPPPRLDLMEDGLRPLRNVAQDCRPAAALTGGVVAEQICTARGQVPELAGATLLRTETVADAAAVGFQPRTIGRETLALLQYTSGSTSDPKGVAIDHGNVLHGEYAVQSALHHHTAERPGSGVCWLPFYHDMCLFGSILQAVYVDAPAYLMSPLTLLQRPLRWLEAITRYQAHTSAGPNFAFDLCVRRITQEQKASLDLSAWEVAAIGAEPVSPATMDRFAAAFACCGFRREAFYPCYGLAEATLLVSGGERDAPPVVRTFSSLDLQTGRGDRGTGGTAEKIPVNSPVPGKGSHPLVQTLVGCGHAWTGHELVIADPETCLECAAGEVGEIWFRGPSVARGYWGREQACRETFQARLAGSGRGPFLRTGDLGFLEAGELFVCGRIKDLIVIRGRNHYPQDIEETVCSVHEAFLPSAAAAFSCRHGDEERLVVLQEIDRQSRRLDLPSLGRAIRQAIAEQHQLQVHELLFLRKASLPKTTSGKVRRQEARQRYLARQLPLWKPAPRAGG